MFEIVVAGRVIENGDVAIAMIEAGAGTNAWHLIYDEGQIKPDEEVVAQGLEAAKPFIKVICEAQNELKEKAAKETKDFQLFPEYTDELYARIDEIAHEDLNEALSIAEKLPRQDRIHEIKEHVREVLANEFTDMDDAEKEKELGNAFKELQRQIVRRRILTEDYRIDGRGRRDDRGDRGDRRGGPRRHSDRDDRRDDRDYDDRPRRSSRRDDRDDDFDDRPRRRRSDRDYDDRDDRGYDRDDRPRRRSDRDDRDYDRDDRRGGRSDDRRGGRRGGYDRNPRYATDENYDEYRADRVERSERPRRRVRRDFDPFEN